jgi:hypothetical protein
LGSSEATAPMSRVHAEIERLTRRLGTHLSQIDATGTIDPERVDDLLACLYGLHAVLALHFTQEEESYFALAATPLSTPAVPRQRTTQNYAAAADRSDRRSPSILRDPPHRGAAGGDQEGPT